MKKVILKSLVIAMLATSFIGCEKKESDEQGCSAAPSELKVEGSVVNEDNQPLESIKVVTELQCQDAENYPWYGYSGFSFTDSEGNYSYPHLMNWHVQKCSEVVITVVDTSGVYETQAKTCAVRVVPRFPEDSTLCDYVDAYATADFVMKKK